MACEDFPTEDLVAGVTQHIVGDVTYIWTGIVWDTETVPLRHSLITKDDGHKASQIDYEVEGGVDRDVQQRLSDTKSILDFGGLDDDDGTLTTTNSIVAFKKYWDYLELIGGGRVYLPKTNTGGYLINGDDTTVLTVPIEIVADEGVYLRIVYSGGVANSPFANNYLKYNRELKKIQHNFGFNNYGAQKAGIRPADTLPTLSSTQGVYTEPRVLSGLNFHVVDLASPYDVQTPLTQTTDTISFDGTGKVIVAGKATSAGEQVFSLISSTAAGKFLAGVQTVHGYAYLEQNSATGELVYTESATGVTSIVIGVGNTVLDQQRDLFNSGLLSVRVISSHKAAVLCNGIVLYSFNTRSSINSVIFGADNVAATINVSQFSSVKTNATGGIKPLRIIAMGDSISDNNVQYSPYNYMSSILQSSGQQVAEILNIAVSGETAAQQLVRLQTIGAGYDFCAVQLGVNDVQGNTPTATFMQTIKDICAYAKNIGAKPIVGMPTQFYSKAEANNNGQTGGQDTQNNQNGGTFRAVLLRAVAAEGGLVNLQSASNMGGVTAKWLNYGVEGVQTDSILVDNIHPTPYGAMMVGLGWAESILGATHKFNDTNTQVPETVPASWLRSGFGVTTSPTVKGAELSGKITFDGATNPDGSPFMQLPFRLRPQVPVTRTAVAIGASGNPVGTLPVLIGVDGNCYVFTPPVDTVTADLGKIDLTEFLNK